MSGGRPRRRSRGTGESGHRLGQCIGSPAARLIPRGERDASVESLRREVELALPGPPVTPQRLLVSACSAGHRRGDQPADSASWEGARRRSYKEAPAVALGTAHHASKSSNRESATVLLENLRIRPCSRSEYRRRRSKKQRACVRPNGCTGSAARGARRLQADRGGWCLVSPFDRNVSRAASREHEYRANSKGAGQSYP